MIFEVIKDPVKLETVYVFRVSADDFIDLPPSKLENNARELAEATGNASDILLWLSSIAENMEKRDKKSGRRTS